MIDSWVWAPSTSTWKNIRTGQVLVVIEDLPGPRDDFIVGTTMPTASNTGVLPGVPRTTDNRTIITGSAVETFQNKTFPNALVLTNAQNKTFVNCLFEGRTGSGEIVRAYDSANANLKFTDCTFAQPEELFPKGYLGTAGGKIGFRGHHVTLLRCKFQNVVDGVRPRRTGGGDAAFVAQGCWIDELLMLAPDTSQADRQSHNDGVQDDQTVAQANVLFDGCWVAGMFNPRTGQADIPLDPPGWVIGDSRTRVKGSRFYPSMTSNVTFQMHSANNGIKDNFIITRCWLSGGSCIVNMGGGIPNGNIDLTFTNNRIGRNMRLGEQYVIIAGPSVVFTAFSGNTYMDNGDPANFRKNG